MKEYFVVGCAEYTIQAENEDEAITAVEDAISIGELCSKHPSLCLEFYEAEVEDYEGVV